MKKFFGLFVFLLLPTILHAQLDTTKWFVFNGLDTNNNGPLNCYQASNVTASGGVMTETVKVVSPDVCTGTTYTNAEISQKTYNFTFGYVETKIKFAGGQGPWPAFWLIGAACQPTAGNCPWPSDAGDAAETDIAEILNSNHTTVNQETHITGGGQQCSATTTDVSANFHTYGLLWTSGSLKWYIDGVQTCSATGASVPAHAQFVLIDVFIGSFGGTVNNATLPQSNSVNYVRVCAGATTPSCTATQAQQAGNFDDEFGASTPATVYYTNSASQVDVADCIAGTGANTCHAGSPTGPQATHTMANGDTINIAAGTVTWTPSGVTVPAGVSGTITGSGTPNSTAATTGASSSCATGTVITLSNITSAQNAMFVANPTIANQSTTIPELRISCMDVKYATGGAAVVFAINGTCNNTACASVRLDNMTYDNWSNQNHDGQSYGISGINNVFGVVDHNTINGAGTTYLEFAEISHSTFIGANDGWFGDNSWASPPMFGTINFLFYENNIFNESGCCETEGGPDPGPQNYLNYRGGTRVVVRHNTFNFRQLGTFVNQFALGWHGTETGSRARSGAFFEFYDNQVNVFASNGPILGLRGGTGIVWGNTINLSSAGTPLAVYVNNRSLGPTGGWPACDGWAVEDDVDVNASASSPAWTGTVTAVGANSHNHVIITLANGAGTGNPIPWTVGQWNPLGAPYSIHDTTLSPTAGYGQEIFGNTTNTITINSGAGGPGQWTPAVNDNIIITRAFNCMDQGAGRGAGQYFSYVNFPSPPFTSSANQASLPAYALFNTWSNQPTNGSGVSTNGTTPITQRPIDNRDFYSETGGQAAQTSPTSPFTGLTDIQPVSAWTCTHGATCTITVPSTTNFAVNDSIILGDLSFGALGFAYIPVETKVLSKTSTSITVDNVANNGGTDSSLGPGGYVATRGAGHGLLSNRPTNCTPSPWTASDPWGAGQYGVAYAEINSSGALVQIDYCIATNTWSTATSSPASYVPYSVYPHPLVVPPSGPAVSFSPVLINFGTVNIGVTSPAQTITVTSTGTTNLTWTSYSTTNPANTTFTATPGATNPCPASNSTGLAPGSSCTVSVTGETNVVGVQNGTFNLVSNAPNSPQTVALSITGGSVTPPACAPSSGIVPQNVTCTNTNTGTTVVCYTLNSTTPVTNGAGTGCSTGTVYTAAISITVASTLEVVAGVAGEMDSSVVSYTYTAGGTNCPNPTSVGVYTFCSEAFKNTPSTTTTSVSLSPFTGNGVELFVSFCGPSCGSPPPAITLTISDNINNPENCFVQSPHSPFSMANTGVPDYETFYILYCPSIPSGVTTITATSSATLGAFDLDAVEWKTGTISPTNYFETVDNLSESGNTTGTTATIVSSGPTVNPNDLVTALVVNCGLLVSNVGPGYTGIILNPSGTPGHIVEAQGVTTIQSLQATMSWSTGTPLGNCGLGQPAPADTWFGVIEGLKSISASIVFNPTIENFGNGGVGLPINSTVTISNPGNTALSVTNTTVSGTNAADFSYSSNTCTAPSFTVPIGGSCILNIQFIPSIVGGETAQLNFTDNSPGSPHVFQMSGRGSGVPLVSLNPTSLSFPSTLAGCVVGSTCPSQVVTLTNVGGAVLGITNISITGLTADYSQVNNCPANLNAGSNCTITVTFNPITTGSLLANLVFADNAPNSPQSVPLSGIGIRVGEAMSGVSMRVVSIK